MGFRSLAQSLLVTASIAAAATTPVFAQQQPTPAPAKPPAAAPAPAATPQQPSAANPNIQVTPGQTQPQAPGTVKSNHGAWSVVCDKPAGAATEQCALMQNVIAEDRPEVGLSVVVLKTADRKSKILRVLAPLGVLLPNGLGLNVDGKDIGRAYFVRCFADGCYAEVVLEDDECCLGAAAEGLE